MTTLLQELKELFDSGKWGSLEETLKHKVAEEQAKQDAAKVSAEVASTPSHDAGDVLDVVREAGYPFLEARTYRIHFKNGSSGEYSGSALATNFPFPIEQVESVHLIALAGE